MRFCPALPTIDTRLMLSALFAGVLSGPSVPPQTPPAPQSALTAAQEPPPGQLALELQEAPFDVPPAQTPALHGAPTAPAVHAPRKYRNPRLALGGLANQASLPSPVAGCTVTEAPTTLVQAKSLLQRILPE